MRIGAHEFQVENGLISFTPEEMEDFLDNIVFDEALARNEEAFPSELVYSIMDGENPVKAYRRYRGMTQTQLAHDVSVSQPQIADIEAGRKDGSVKTMKAIAEALRVDLDMIV